jgi:hypothetical protein
MNGKIAWVRSARAFEASQNERLPRLVRRVFLRFGIAWFWTALALEGRALEVWRDQRAERDRARTWTLAGVWSRFLETVKGLVWRPPAAECAAVLAWSLPDSRRIRGLGLGCMWAVLCPYCRDFHTHSPGEGHRMPHCCSERDGRRYALEFAGPLPVEYRLRFCLSVRSVWPRLLQQWPQPGHGFPAGVDAIGAAQPAMLEAA